MKIMAEIIVNMFLIWLKCISSSSIWVLEKGKWKNSQLSASAKSNQISKKAGGKIEQKHTNIHKNTNILLLVWIFSFIIYHLRFDLAKTDKCHLCGIILVKKCDYPKRFWMFLSLWVWILVYEIVFEILKCIQPTTWIHINSSSWVLMLVLAVAQDVSFFVPSDAFWGNFGAFWLDQVVWGWKLLQVVGFNFHYFWSRTF